MKRVLIAASLLLCSSVMYADLIPSLVSITPISTGPFAGDFDWTYTISLAAGQQVVPALGLGGAQPWPNFFNIIDFGSPTSVPLTVPAGWGGDANLLNAAHAFMQNAPNQSNISDVQINFTGSTAITGPQTICCFSFVATTAAQVLGWYEGQGTNGANGTEQGNVGRVMVPLNEGSNLQQIPEPATFILLGSSLVAIGFLRRKV